MNLRSRITGGPLDEIFQSTVLAKHAVRFFRCRETGFVQPETPWWLEEAYASPINVSDTGVVHRNQRFLPTVASILFSYFEPDARFLDYAGGYGLFTRMLRDAGFDGYWDDPYTANLCARGFEGAEAPGPFDAVTAFEVLEHFVEPRRELQKILEHARFVVVSTLLIPEPVPPPEAWWYYGLEHGQHVAFYTEKALEALASAHGLRAASNGADLHCFIDPAHLPRRVVGGWMQAWLQHQPAEVAESVRALYDFEPLAPRRAGWGERLKVIHRRRTFPGLYHLKSQPAGERAQSVRAAGLPVDYVRHLLHDGHTYWPRLAPRMTSRTVSDMLLLRERERKRAASPPRT